jgi:hypothetical protein
VQSFYDGKYEIAGIRCKNKCYFFCELIWAIKKIKRKNNIEF